VLVAPLVVEQRLALHRVLGVLERHARVPPPAGGRARELQRVQRRPGVAPGARGEELDDLVGQLDALALPGVDRAPQEDLEVAGLERVELVDLRPGDQRGVDLEVRVLGRRPDQRHDGVLHRRQQLVLLGLVEAMDLVEEEDRRASAASALGRPREYLADFGLAGVDGRELLERRRRVDGGEPRDRRLAGARRAVQDHRVDVPGLERGAQRRALAQQVALPDDVVERARPQPNRERPVGRRLGERGLAGIEQTIHAESMGAGPVYDDFTWPRPTRSRLRRPTS
jgi:hypothetical protein